MQESSRKQCEEVEKNVDVKGFEPLTFRKRYHSLAIMQSGRATTAPNAHAEKACLKCFDSVLYPAALLRRR